MGEEPEALRAAIADRLVRRDSGAAAEGSRARLSIAKRFAFEAAHHLEGLAAGHKCGRVHGHSYQVEVVLSAEHLTTPGFVTDFGDLAPFGDYLAAELDHRDLNQVLAFAPTSELLALHFAGWLADHVEPLIPGYLTAVRVSETAGSWAQVDLDREQK